MILFSQCEMEIMKVEPDAQREAVLLVSRSEDSQYHIKEEDHSDSFTFISVKPEDKVGKTVSSVRMKNNQFKNLDE
jgi:hypothetical protein